MSYQVYADKCTYTHTNADPLLFYICYKYRIRCMALYSEIEFYGEFKWGKSRVKDSVCNIIQCGIKKTCIKAKASSS